MATGVYWLGQDGNYYVKAEGVDGVQNMGRSIAPYAPGALTEIRDPALGSTAPSGGGSGGAALNQGAVNNTQMTIDQIPRILQEALAAESQKYSNAVSGFNAQEQTQRKNYDASTVTNQQNYDANFMDSIRAGIKGLSGLMQVLRGTGAAGSSVEGDVRDTVGGVTAQDIRTGADTQKENQGQLDNSLSTFLTDLGIKRKQNEDTLVNNQRALQRNSDSQLQDLYSKMAGYYGDAGRTAEANTWLSRAGSLTPNIAANTAERVGAYDSTPVAVQAPQLTAFAEPTQPNVVTAPSDGQIGSGIFTVTDRRRDRQAPALTGA